MITIEQIDSSYVVVHTGSYEHEEGTFTDKSLVIEDDERKCMESLLYKIAEELGVQYNKWNKDNLNITWDKKGHKLD